MEVSGWQASPPVPLIPGRILGAHWMGILFGTVAGMIASENRKLFGLTRESKLCLSTVCVAAALSLN
jgi:hypothetical protein